jgi:hypothetical protein
VEQAGSNWVQRIEIWENPIIHQGVEDASTRMLMPGIWKWQLSIDGWINSSIPSRPER